MPGGEVVKRRLTTCEDNGLRNRSVCCTNIRMAWQLGSKPKDRELLVTRTLKDKYILK